ncbi:transcription elongation factor GreAB [Lactobacillus sp. ESL0791]|uniref:type II toxin-antitoxin system PemI/MazE family antitoxin n=1 Tax=Lactobacillus sp. ESL0791 TaxID=2983234 RepID=UPI0023F6301D|nr:transcription elongation factor GreAB [Lactobacillus sp. ESL0791]MDF7639844.1 transcription elongation factor GreAB [Lactobacillus sp. ESL0791]
MSIVKVAKRGNGLCLTLPSKDKFKLNQSWLLIANEKGGYELIPKLEDPYKQPDFKNQYEPEEWPNTDYREVE